ncbi:Ribonucleoside-diphosphate reductase subunit beta nrdF2 [Candidatus Hepatoplasma crinochetorum Av]|uniref:Ribonucleoside-diphosphate reductase subunit beta n=1 Tax=Candidatus Hepatoplasma crinochetorum Av TaxID=1427984 RepID=W8GF88_9MOLU|nr:class 1b ribonucleoside-diphosphate reductase subunit beta [Candidatus Hepatoplasma crinochetorum]AHK22419.1 Ribonucleoside-diphosphate reductase subunit beta nrdF2 [Candidatus Hepatoplasma crinochetorum Av]
MLNKKEKIIKAINWNKIENSFTKLFWDQNIRQFWVDEEISLVEDRKHWDKLTKAEKDTYEKVLAGLTLLDTEQGGVGMPLILEKIDDLHIKAVFSFMGAMEQMHAKSYSTIFSTLSSSERINELFNWVENNKYLQYKVNKVDYYYRKINNQEELFFALTTSVLLETFLFYSGFFYPLWFSGQGKLVGSGEIINLIIRDESVHGTFVGLIAQKIFKKFDQSTKDKLTKKVYELMLDLYQNEIKYTKDLYNKVNLADEVIKFIQYNADKALMNFGFEPYFNVIDEDINPIILNGLDTETKTHDFFSTKGNGYIKPIIHDELSDEDFDDF